MTKPIKDSKKPLQEPNWWSKYWFYTVLILLAVIGVPSAFFVPTLIPGLINDGNSIVSVRQGILAVLAGALTMLTLSETHRKNNHEKNKNERDHIRQVHAERRNRYTKAVEQLANEKAAVRLGGIYTLVGLVDEWLADESLTKDKQKEEGQVIINNLCSYIRSPFPLAEEIEEYEARKRLEELKKKESENTLIGAEPLTLMALSERFTNTQNYKKPEDITTDYAKFHEEQDVRRTIFVEMSKRSSSFSRNEKDDVFKTTRRTWSDFDFDFSRAPIFYPLNEITIEKGNFSSAKFYNSADFRCATFTQNANFSWVTFTQDAYFIGTTFTQNADFRCATFTQIVHFSAATFTNNVDFRQTTFESIEPIFVTEKGKARFSTDINWQGSDFSATRGNISINCGTASFLGKSFTIPLETVLFDPDSWDEEKQDYTRFSDPAEPLDNSDGGEENKTE